MKKSPLSNIDLVKLSDTFAKIQEVLKPLNEQAQVAFASEMGEMEKEDEDEIAFRELSYKVNSLGWDMEEFRRSIKQLWEEISYINRNLSSHINNGHIPAIPGAGKLKEVLKTLGLDKDYKVEEQRIYASTGELAARQFLLKSADLIK